MTVRDEAFRRMLGREPAADEHTDIATLRDTTQLRDSDPFWGLIAYLYARTKPDIEARAQLRSVTESLQALGLRLDGALETLKDPPAPQCAGGSPDGLGILVQTAVVSALADWAPPPRSSIQTWLGTQVPAVRYTVGVLAAVLFLAIVAAYGAGERIAAARQATLEARAPRVAAWARTPTGQRVYAWARLNAPSLGTLLSCGYPGWLRQRQDGYTVCYPNGRGHGFYLPTP